MTFWVKYEAPGSSSRGTLTRRQAYTGHMGEVEFALDFEPFPEIVGLLCEDSKWVCTILLLSDCCALGAQDRNEFDLSTECVYCHLPWATELVNLGRGIDIHMTSPDLAHSLEQWALLSGADPLSALLAREAWYGETVKLISTVIEAWTPHPRFVSPTPLR